MTSAAYLYLRLSKDKATSSDSLDDQERKLRDRARAEGLDVATIYSDGAGRSAYGAKGLDRPEWARLVQEVPAGSVVMAVETSRFSRDTEDGLRQIRQLRARDVHVLTLDGNDTRTEGSALPLTVRLAVAEEESRMKAERLKRARDRDRRLGKWAGRSPYGHRRRQDGRLELDPETAPVVRRMVDLYLSGLGAGAIARTLNEDGIPNPNGRPWRQVSVSALLRNPVLCGWLPHQDRPYLGEDGEPVVCVVGPTIVTTGERGRLQQTARGRTRLDHDRRRGSGRPARSLLGDLLLCGRCGSRMATQGTSYSCTGRTYGGSCQGLTTLRERIDAEVLSRVLAYAAALDVEDDRLRRIGEAWIGTAPAVSETSLQAAGDLTEARQRLAVLEEDHYVRGILDADRFQELRAALTARISTLEVAAAQEGPALDLGPLLDLVNSREAAEDASPEVLRSLIAAAVESVVLDPPPMKGARFDPDRVRVTWRA
ncbi:MAG: recombinase family protein [Microthrixaceae bacterium]